MVRADARILQTNVCVYTFLITTLGFIKWFKIPSKIGTMNLVNGLQALVAFYQKKTISEEWGVKTVDFKKKRHPRLNCRKLKPGFKMKIVCQKKRGYPNNHGKIKNPGREKTDNEVNCCQFKTVVLAWEVLSTGSITKQRLIPLQPREKKFRKIA